MENDVFDLGPICEHGRYKSRCVDCGAEPLNASVAVDAIPKPDPRKPSWRVVDALDAFIDARAAETLSEERSAIAAGARRELADALEALVTKTAIPIRAVFGDVAPGKVREG